MKTKRTATLVQIPDVDGKQHLTEAGVGFRQVFSPERLRAAGLPQDVTPYDLQRDESGYYLAGHSSDTLTTNCAARTFFDQQVMLARKYCRNRPSARPEGVATVFPTVFKEAPGDSDNARLDWIARRIIAERDDDDPSAASTELYENSVNQIDDLKAYGSPEVIRGSDKKAAPKKPGRPLGKAQEQFYRTAGRMAVELSDSELEARLKAIATALDEKSLRPSDHLPATYRAKLETWNDDPLHRPVKTFMDVVAARSRFRPGFSEAVRDAKAWYLRQPK